MPPECFEICLENILRITQHHSFGRDGQQHTESLLLIPIVLQMCDEDPVHTQLLCMYWKFSECHPVEIPLSEELIVETSINITHSNSLTRLCSMSGSFPEESKSIFSCTIFGPPPQNQYYFILLFSLMDENLSFIISPTMFSRPSPFHKSQKYIFTHNFAYQTFFPLYLSKYLSCTLYLVLQFLGLFVEKWDDI